MDLITAIREKAKTQKKHIVLAEGTEKRTVAAAAIITRENIASITLLGNKAEIKAVAAEVGADLTGVEVIDPLESDKLSEYANVFFKLREK